MVGKENIKLYQNQNVNDSRLVVMDWPCARKGE